MPLYNHTRLREINKLLKESEASLGGIKKQYDYTMIDKIIGENLQRLKLIKIQINILMGEK
jgi:hypothetical protein